MVLFLHNKEFFLLQPARVRCGYGVGCGVWGVWVCGCVGVWVWGVGGGSSWAGAVLKRLREKLARVQSAQPGYQA